MCIQVILCYIRLDILMRFWSIKITGPKNLHHVIDPSVSYKIRNKPRTKTPDCIPDHISV